MPSNTVETTNPRLFDSNGIRGVVGDVYTPNFVADIACAYGTWLGAAGSVLIAQDFRTTSSGISHILAGALQMLGFDIVELGPMPTPCFRFNVHAFGAKGGLMVTASHCPPEYNGIQFTDPRGLGLSRESQSRIQKIFESRQFLRPDWMSAGTIRSDASGVDRYLASIHNHIDHEAIRRAHLPVVLDPGNGTSAVSSPRLLRDIGCEMWTINSSPDGLFPGRLSEPSEENLGQLGSSVSKLGAAVGIAHDGDADRVAFVDERGRYLSGDAALALLARYVLQRNPGGTVVTSVTTSSVVRDEVERAGGWLVVTRSGPRSVALGIERAQAVLGGEGTGQCYWPEHQIAPDGPMTSAMMLELLAHEARPLSQLVSELPVYHLRSDIVPVEPALQGPALRRSTALLRERAERIDATDGVKAYFPGGWLLLQPSETEPAIRVLAEGTTVGCSTAFIEEGLGVVREALAAAPVTERGVVAA